MHHQQNLAGRIIANVVLGNQQWPDVKLHQIQCCSLNNLDSFGKIETSSALPMAGTQGVVAHFALYPSGIESVATGTDALLQYLV
jgi:hypothetical protein